MVIDVPESIRAFPMREIVDRTGVAGGREPVPGNTAVFPSEVVIALSSPLHSPKCLKTLGNSSNWRVVWIDVLMCSEGLQYANELFASYLYKSSR